MELENQVCSLKLAKRLKELEVKQESLWYWQKSVCIKNHHELLSVNCFRDKNNIYKDNRNYSAFTVAELGEMLPLESHYIRTELHRNSMSDTYKYLLHICGKDFYADTEANARAKMLIYLLENNLIKKSANRGE